MTNDRDICDECGKPLGMFYASRPPARFHNKCYKDKLDRIRQKWQAMTELPSQITPPISDKGDPAQ